MLTFSPFKSTLKPNTTIFLSLAMALIKIKQSPNPIESISQLMCMYEEIGLDFQLMAAQAQVEDSVLTLETIEASSCKMGGQQHHAHFRK